MSASRRSSLWIAGMCVALTAVAGQLAGCSKSAEQQSQTADQTSEASKKPTTGTAGKLPTIADYIKQNNITEASAKRDDPEVPKIALPMLPGWADAGKATPDYAYAASIGVDPALQPDPPSAVVLLSKLGDSADPAEILSLAPNEIRNLPDFRGSDPLPGKLDNFDATRISGSYSRNGNPRVIEQTTAVIPGKGGFYILQINVDGVQDQIEVLMQAVESIDKHAKITVAPG